MRPISRRAFLQTSTLAAAIARVRAENKGALVGTQVYGWGQFYEREHQVLTDHWDDVFSAAHDCGYDYVEGMLDTLRPDANTRFADRFKARGLKAVSIYTGARLHEREPADRAIADIVQAAGNCATAGYQIINCNPEPIGREKSDAELKIQAESLNKLGRELQRLGLKLGVHNHTPEMKNGAREFRHNFTATDPRYVGFCYDVNWVYRGGLQPEQVLKEFGNRVVDWHLRQSQDGIWTEDLTYGDIDYQWIAQYAQAHNLPQIYTVELALENGTIVTRSGIENHRRSRAFVRRLMGV